MRPDCHPIFRACAPSACAASLLALVAGAAHAQAPAVTYEVSYRSIPSGGSVIRFSESAEIVLTARFNPPVGTVMPNLPPPGTVAGLGMINFDVIGCGGNAGGAWTLSGPGFTGSTGANWGIRSGWQGSAGTAQPNGDVLGCSAGLSFVGTGPNPINPVAEIWRGRWTPPHYTAGALFRFSIVPAGSSLFVGNSSEPGGFALVPAQSIASSIEIRIDPGQPGPCTPWIIQPPRDTTGYVGYPVHLSVSAVVGTGCAPIAYRWRKGCMPLSDGGNISGSGTAILTIDPVMAADAGDYSVSVGGYLTSSVRLSVGCYANCDGSTASPALNVNDFICFQQRFAAAEPVADCDRSGGLNVLDFVCFQSAFAAGCP